ncbi:winged helix-turn-helix transcriptional regulator [Pseudonocardia spinosispora]|uniref:winged helix-turn-helix transcriptional regulator n=1 Tax=Pseudonocardia spinosispora TaxID=103441 RepID=UPI00040071BF|nr:helix-turn-helix domain-containing protein [Pseudonocardia spinosispora]
MATTKSTGATRRSGEPIADAGQRLFKLVSERWNILILREVAFGTNRFGELQRALCIAPNVLTSKLNALTEAGLLEQRPYRDDKPWYEYHLTKAAIELTPALVIIARLGDASLGAPEGQRREVRHTRCGQVAHSVLTCSACHEELTPTELSYVEKSEATDG